MHTKLHISNVKIVPFHHQGGYLWSDPTSRSFSSAPFLNVTSQLKLKSLLFLKSLRKRFMEKMCYLIGCNDSSGQHRQGGGQRLSCPSAYVSLMSRKSLHPIMWDIKSKHLFLKYLKNDSAISKLFSLISLQNITLCPVTV